MLSVDKFFTNNQHYPWCIMVLLLSLGGSGAIAQQDASTSPISGGETTAPAAIPSSLQPPDLPDRGVSPQIQKDIRLPESVSGNTPKKSLSWMAGFNRLLQERIAATNSGRPPANSSTVRTFDGSFSNCLLALVNACSLNGSTIDTLNSNAGELIVTVPSQTKKRLLFLVSEMPVGKTTISATTESGSLNSSVSQIQKILDATGQILEKRSSI